MAKSAGVARRADPEGEVAERSADVGKDEMILRFGKLGEFVPFWKNLQTWINQRCWEEEEGSEYKPAEDKPVVKASDFFGTK